MWLSKRPCRSRAALAAFQFWRAQRCCFGEARLLHPALYITSDPRDPTSPTGANFYREPERFLSLSELGRCYVGRAPKALIMDDLLPESPDRMLARERSHQEAAQTAVINRMLVQSLVLVNGGAAIAGLAYYGAHDGTGKSAAPLTIVLYCLGVFAAIFAGLYVRRTTQESSSFWELKSYPDMVEREKVLETHRQQAIQSKRWSTGLLVFSEVLFLAASLSLATSLG
jgi:hypothetical protein